MSDDILEQRVTEIELSSDHGDIKLRQCPEEESAMFIDIDGCGLWMLKKDATKVIEAIKQIAGIE